jgi:hypothetical protein
MAGKALGMAGWLPEGMVIESARNGYDGLFQLILHFPTLHLPSGKLRSLWKITMLLMGKSTISMAIFNSYVKLPEGILAPFMFWTKRAFSDDSSCFSSYLEISELGKNKPHQRAQ